RRAKYEWSEEKWDNYKQKHSENNTGEDNGNYSGITNEELYQAAFNLTKSLGRKFSQWEWQALAKDNNYPLSFSSWRRDSFGTVANLAKMCALELGFEYVDADPRTLRAYKEALEQGYDAFIEDSHVYVN